MHMTAAEKAAKGKGLGDKSRKITDGAMSVIQGFGRYALVRFARGAKKKIKCPIEAPQTCAFPNATCGQRGNGAQQCGFAHKDEPQWETAIEIDCSSRLNANKDAVSRWPIEFEWSQAGGK